MISAASGCGDAAGRRTNPLAAMIRSTKEKRMQKATAITCVFLDIGGVLLPDGWDHHARKRAATNFKLELAEMEDRHLLNFDTYEEGKLTMEEYLGQVDFYQERPFTRAQVVRDASCISIRHGLSPPIRWFVHV